jgi:hypothetical protein
MGHLSQLELVEAIALGFLLGRLILGRLLTSKLKNCFFEKIGIVAGQTS